MEVTDEVFEVDVGGLSSSEVFVVSVRGLGQAGHRLVRLTVQNIHFFNRGLK